MNEWGMIKCIRCYNSLFYEGKSIKCPVCNTVNDIIVTKRLDKEYEFPKKWRIGKED